MELDDYKTAWNKENTDAAIPEISLGKQQEIHHPLARIRANMRLEFWSTVVLLLLVFAVIAKLDLEFTFKFYIIVIVGSMVLVTMFFYSRFFRLYRELSRTDFSTVESLKDLMGQFDLNEQYYVSFYVSFVPFLVCELIVTAEFSPAFQLQSHTYFVVFFLVAVAVSLALMYLLGRWWFCLFYGKYIRKIRLLYRELTASDDDVF